ncbi:MAG: L-histidine N(alpha)-methyltransferase, partial [Planctomycetota bacterium]
VVVRATDDNAKKEVAIKLFDPDPTLTSKKRFSREVKRLKAIKHENVVQYIGDGISNGISYIIMNYVEGERLMPLIRNPIKVAKLIIQVAKGIDALRSKNIVHRDIKPANLIVSEDHTTITIVDIGITRQLGEKTITPEGAFIGTPEYASPEQASGDGIDSRSDLFSLGTVMYFALTGKNPFVRKGIIETLKAVSEDSPPPIQSIDTSLSDIIEKLHQKEPRDRYQTPSELVVALEACLEILNAKKENSSTIDFEPFANGSDEIDSSMLRSYGGDSRAHRIFRMVMSIGSHTLSKSLPSDIAEHGAIDYKHMYMDPVAIRKWQAVLEDPTYAVYARCKNVLSRLCRGEYWNELVNRPHVRIVELGVGAGTKDNVIMRSAVEKADKVELVLLDASVAMLEQTADSLDENVLANADIHYVRGDFYRLTESLRGIIYNPADPSNKPDQTIYLLLGGTFGNLRERQFIHGLNKVMEVGDLAIIAAECTDNPDDLSEDLSAMYGGTTVRELAALSARLLEPELSLSTIAEAIEIGEVTGEGVSEVPHAKTVELSWYSGRFETKVQLVKISRYNESELRDFFESQGFSILRTIKEPRWDEDTTTYAYYILSKQ